MRVSWKYLEKCFFWLRFLFFWGSIGEEGTKASLLEWARRMFDLFLSCMLPFLPMRTVLFPMKYILGLDFGLSVSILSGDFYILFTIFLLDSRSR